MVFWVSGCGDDEKPRLSCEELSSRLQDALTKAVADEGLAGATAGVKLRDCNWTGAAGSSRLEPSAVPMAPGDRLRAGSIAKTFTAVVALQLQAEGKLSLDAPLATWFADFPNADRITVRQLLNHTSGAADYTDNEDFVARASSEPTKVWTAEELIPYGATRSPLFEPGAGWSYSNTNYILVGAIIEQVTGTPVARQWRERIIEPLKLRDTGLDGLEPLPALTVRGYARLDGAWVDFTDAVHPSAAGASGGLVSTAEDLNRFYEALLVGVLLPPAQLSEMTRWVATEPGAEPSYGLGLLRAGSPLGPFQGHDGGIPGFSALAGYYADREAAVSVLTNQQDGNASAVTLRLLEVVAKR
nr:serine hydrolase domain-containing protein [Pyxidicoccus fallax]